MLHFPLLISFSATPIQACFKGDGIQESSIPRNSKQVSSKNRKVTVYFMSILSKPAAGLLSGRQIANFEELRDFIVGWNADFRQLDAERFQSEVFQGQVGSILLTGGHFGCSVKQNGMQPPGMRSFAIPDQGCPEMQWYNHIIGSDALLSFPVHGEVDIHSRPGFGVTVFSIPENLLARFLDKNQGRDVKSLLGNAEKVFYSSPERLEKTRKLCRTIKQIDTRKISEAPLQTLALDLEEQLLTSVFEIIEDRRPVLRTRPSYRRPKLKKLLELINHTADDNLKISELCDMADLPERTAQYLFQQELGLRPKAYQKGIKLQIAHRQLWLADPSATFVSDIANRLGFWHMGQFAADYQKQFGILPSETLKHL